MTLLEEIQESAVRGDESVGALLRKCKILAARLDASELEQWTLHESNGYPNDAEVPRYRIWALELRGNFAGGFGASISNALIPMSLLPDLARDSYENFTHGKARVYALTAGEVTGEQMAAIFLKAIPKIETSLAHQEPPYAAKIQRSGKVDIIWTKKRFSNSLRSGRWD